MNEDPNNPKTVWGAVALSVAVVAVCFLAFDPLLVSFDAGQHLRAAHYLLSGSGYSTDLLYYDFHYQAGTLPAPETHWPPGFSVAVVPLLWLGLAPPVAGLLLVLGGFLVAGWSVRAILTRAGLSGTSGLVWMGVWCAYVFGISEVLKLGSAPLVAGTSALAVAVLLRGTTVSVGRAGVAGILAAVGLSMHFLGLAFVAALGAWTGLHWLRHRRDISIGVVAAAVLPGAAVAVLLFARSARLTGSLTSQAGTETGTPLAEVARGLFWAIDHLLALRPDGFVAPEAAEWLWTVAVGAGALMLWAGRRAGQTNRARPAAWTRALELSALAIVALAGMLVTLSLRGDVRYVSTGYYWLPVVPFVLVVLGVAWSLAVERAGSERRTVRTVALVLGFSAFVASGVEQLNASFDPGVAPAVNTALDTPVPTDGPQGVVRLRTLLRDSVDVSAPLIANESQLVGMLIDRPVLGFPPVPYRSAPVTADSVRQIAERYGSRFVLLLPGAFDPSAPANRHLTFVSEFMDRGGAAVETVIAGPDAVLIRLR